MVVTLLVISIAVVALLGGLLTSTSASISHRGMTNLDGVLKSFAESARYQIETQPTFGPGKGPQFTPCAQPQNYTVAGTPNPTSGPVGTAVTVFGLGLTSPGTVTVGATAASPVTSSGGVGGSTTTFNIPSLSTGVYVIKVGGVPAATPFTVTSGSIPPSSPPSGPLTGYTLSTTMDYWGGSSFNLDHTGCTSPINSNSDLQRLNLHMTETVQGNAASDTVQVVLANYKSKVVSNVSLSGTAGPHLGSPITLTASVAPFTGVPNPTGNITWSAPSGTSACATGAAPTATCTINNPGAGTYGATYGGDGNYSGGPASPPYVVPRYAEGISVALTSPPTPPNPAAPANLTFTATFNGVTGFTPTGTILWNGPCTGTTAVTGSGPAYTSTCSATGVAAGTYSETATYQTGSDPNYTDGTSGSASVTVINGTSTSVTASPANPTAPANLTFTANVITPGGTLTATLQWTGVTCNITTWNPGTGQGTCLLNNQPVGSYTATATYPGDSTHGSSSGSATSTVKNAATVNVPAGVLSGQGSNKTLTFTATVTGSAGTPTGTVQWSISTNGPAATCANSTLNNGHATCTITGNLSASNTYTVTANYLGSATYAPASGTSPPTQG